MNLCWIHILIVYEFESLKQTDKERCDIIAQVSVWHLQFSGVTVPFHVVLDGKNAVNGAVGAVRTLPLQLKTRFEDNMRLRTKEATVRMDGGMIVGPWTSLSRLRRSLKPTLSLDLVTWITSENCPPSVWWVSTKEMPFGSKMWTST